MIFSHFGLNDIGIRPNTKYLSKSVVKEYVHLTIGIWHTVLYTTSLAKCQKFDISFRCIIGFILIVKKSHLSVKVS